MKTIQLFLTGLLAVLIGHASMSFAEDIDIYSGTTANGVPNLMFVVDNPASQNNTVADCTYWDGTPSSNSPNALGNDQCALANIVHGLATSESGAALINLGITHMCGILLPLTPIDNNPYPNTPVTRTFDSGPCNPTNDHITYTIPAGATNREAFIIAVKAMKPNTGKSGQGSELQETWAYYTGGNGGSTGTGILSGMNYSGAHTTAPTSCAKNYIIYLSNVKAGASHAQQYDSTELSVLQDAISNAVTNGTLASTPTPATITPSLEAGQGREWARFMSGVDINNSEAGTGLQSIITYSVATGATAIPPTAITNTMERYIEAVATYGGGRYYPAGNDSTVLTNSILKILNDVQAVNSVFSSSSLPVSVNAQGTYLNQIYMGMFRPDQNGNPRWAGNLKQYQFVATRDPDTNLITLSLGDSIGNVALNPATGFISTSAVSYWTTKNASLPDSIGGFWINDKPKLLSVGGAFDSPDGEWVDKGGSAQMVRLANLTKVYPTDAGTGSGMRKLYTCTGTCAINQPLSNYLFDSSNSNLTDLSLSIVPTVSISSISRTGSTATVTTSSAHGVTTGTVVQVSGAEQSEYNGSFVMTAISPTALTYNINVSPASPATGTITATLPGPAVAITSLTRAGSTVTVSTAGNTFTTGDTITISGVTPTAYNGSWTIACGGSCNPFTFTGPAEGPVTPSGGGTATVGGSTKNIESVTTAPSHPVPGLQRVGTTVTVTTTAKHDFATGNLVTIAGAADSGYNIAARPITIIGNANSSTSFTYTLPCTTPCTPATVLGTASKPSTAPVSVNLLTRALGAGAAATVTASLAGDITAAPYSLSVNSSYPISISGAGQSEYNSTFTATVTGASSFTYPIITSPVTTATGTMTLGSAVTKADLINWVRGEDNAGDEFGPDKGVTITIRPSLHGDVLHSRPVVINYGDTTGVVLYYGGNDGVFRAVNGNQTAAIGSVPAGGELWGFIPTEFFSKLKRLHDNSPILDLPSTIPGISPDPQKKDYFADGSTGVYQKSITVEDPSTKVKTTTNTVYIFMSMRRGGRLIYALDVSDPAAPKYLWKITNTGDFTELGQSWSAPKVALIKGYNTGAPSYTPIPVLIFGAGYDTAEDASTVVASTRSMGRGIYIVRADTGALVWKATYSASSGCSGTSSTAACTVSAMSYSIPADITLMDRDSDGYIDRLYAADVGGNVWRVDLQPQGNTIDNTPNLWRVNKVAALGSEHKFFYPPDVIAAGDYDAVIIGSGDREHPLSKTTSDSIFMLKDISGDDGSIQATIVEGDLIVKTLLNTYSADVLTSSNDTNKGYIINLLSGEKAVNAPLTVAGSTYLGTNQPSDEISCSANLGIARGYKLDPLTGIYTSKSYIGGGLPPSPVAGVVNVIVKGESTISEVPFCIGCGGDTACVGADCTSALGGGKPSITVPTSRTRTYWYQEID